MIFQNKSESLIKKTNEAQYAYGYICLLLEKHMAIHVLTISWKYKASFKYDFEWWINKRDHNSWKYFMLFFKQSSSLFLVVYKGMHPWSTYPILQTTYQNNFLFSRVNSWENVEPTWQIRLRVGRCKWNFRAGCIWANSLWLCVYGSEFLVRRKQEESFHQTDFR